MRSRSRPLVLLGMGLVLGCSAERDPSEVLGPARAAIPVVDAVLLVGQPLPVVNVSRTLDPREPFDIDAAGVAGARVQIEAGGDTVFYHQGGGISGRYLPILPPPIVEPETLYRLRVEMPGGAVVTAATLTPPAFAIDRWVILDESGTEVTGELATFEEVGDGVYTDNRLVHSEGLLEARFDRPDVPGFQVGVFSLDLDSDFAIDVSFLTDEDIAQIERNGSSPPLLAEDSTLRLPWLAVLFEGRHLIRIHAVDENWYDLVRSIPELGGGPGFGGNLGDDFETPLFHVSGGIGLFGSASVDSVGFFVTASSNR